MLGAAHALSTRTLYYAFRKVACLSCLINLSSTASKVPLCAIASVWSPAPSCSCRKKLSIQGKISLLYQNRTTVTPYVCWSCCGLAAENYIQRRLLFSQKRCLLWHYPRYDLVYMDHLRNTNSLLKNVISSAMLAGLSKCLQALLCSINHIRQHWGRFKDKRQALANSNELPMGVYYKWRWSDEGSGG